MSEILAKVSKIENVENLNIVTFTSKHNTLKMMSLELNESIKITTEVKLNAKPSSIAIAKEFIGELSYSNQLNAKIRVINSGELLTSLTLDIQDAKIESLITSSSARRMNLKVGDHVLALIKSSDLSIVEIL